MRNRAVSACVVLMLAVIRVSSAQPNREALYRHYSEFPSQIRGGVVHPSWYPDGRTFWFADHGPDSTVIYKVDPAANNKTPLFDLSRTRAAIASVLGHQPAYRGLPFGTFSWVGGQRVRFEVEGKGLELDLSSYDIVSVPTPTAAEVEFRTPRRLPGWGYPIMEIPSPDGRWFALHEANNLWLRSTVDGQLRQLTTDGNAEIEWIIGGGNFIRPPMGRWSPDGSRLAAFKLDGRNVRTQPIVEWLDPAEQVRMGRNPVAGGALEQLQIGIVDALSQQVVMVDHGKDRDQYLSLVGWRPDGKELWYYRMSRDFRQLDLMTADPATGQSRVILTETSKTFIEGYTDWPTWACTPLWDRGQLLWLSERDGYRHIYLYDATTGQVVQRLTSGTFPVSEVTGVDSKGGVVYFRARSDPSRPYDTHLHRVTLQGQGMTRLTKEPGQHTVTLAPSFEYFIDAHTAIDRPGVVELKRIDGSRLQILSQADTTRLAPLKRQPIESFIAKAADGTTDLYGVIFKPFDFDPSRKYPVIELFYPGDQITSVPREFAFRSYLAQNAQSWAQRGYITFIVDGRGTPERSKAFQDVVYLNHGKNEIPDHAAVVRQLTRRYPFMDSTRVGVWGHSWGGYFAIRAMLLAPDVYQVGVASAPLSDLENHYTPTEPYMLTPQENPDGYRYADNRRFADRLKGKLLMVVGSNDGAHLLGSTLRQAQAFIEADRLFDMMVLPGQDHGFVGAGARFNERYVLNYFATHLKPTLATP